MKDFVIYGGLWNFDIASQDQSIKLGDYIVTRVDRSTINPNYQKLFSAGIDLKEVNFLMTLVHLYSTQPNRDFPHFVVRTEMHFKEEFDFSKADHKIKFLLSALRLHKDGDVLGRFLSAIPKRDYRKEMIPFDFDSYHNLQNKYVLDSTEDFEKFLQKLNNLEELLGFLSFDRFNLSYAHYNSPHERLIDLVIVLESLFNKSPFDVKFKIALRVSHLLYPERSEERHETYESLLEAYDVRNNIVHGLRIVTREEVETHNKTLNQIVRQVLISALKMRSQGKLDLFRTGRDIEKDIDKVLLNT